MQKIKKHPVETIVLLVIFYAIFFSSSWSGRGLFNKTISLIIASLVFLIILAIRFAWYEKYSKIKERTLQILNAYINTKTPLKYAGYLFLAMMTVGALSFLELIVTLISYGSPPVVIGFPYPVYSFSINRLLWFGIILDIILYSVLFYLIVRITAENES